MKLPGIADEIAELIGVDKTLYFISQLPVKYIGSKGKAANRITVYIRYSVDFNHRLVQILGLNDAEKICEAFGGEILQLPNYLNIVYNPYRDDNILRLLNEGVPREMLADWFDVSFEHVRRINFKANPPKGIKRR